MKVHPIPTKLKRLPHVFAKVLQLPFHSDTDVSVQETSESFLFTATTDDITQNVQAHAIEIYPGVTKVVIRGVEDGDSSSSDELALDLWRFRLPASTRPEQASASCFGGELVIAVPKILNFETLEDVEDQEGEMGCGEVNGRLVLVE